MEIFYCKLRGHGFRKFVHSFFPATCRIKYGPVPHKNAFFSENRALRNNLRVTFKRKIYDSYCLSQFVRKRHHSEKIVAYHCAARWPPQYAPAP